MCAPQRVGDILGLLFRILLEHLRETAYLHRCRVKPPKMCTDVRKFHTKHFKTFSQQFPTETIYPFLQVYVLYELLFDYWNTDRERRVMCPFDPQRWARCTAKWGDSLACRSEPSFQTCKYLLFEWLPCRAEASYQIANAFNLRVEYL